MKTGVMMRRVASMVWAGLLGFTASAAQDGDIRGIRVWDNQAGAWVESLNTAATPFQTGEEIKFKIRLLNRGGLVKAMNPTWTNPWGLKYVGSGVPALDELQNPLKLGVWVSGKSKPATIQFEPDTTGYYTDMICTYTVEAGDLALPLKLAWSVNGTAAEAFEMDAGFESPAYYLYNTTSWGIYDNYKDPVAGGETVRTNQCNFWFGPETLDPEPFPSWTPSNEGPYDIDLSKAGIFIRALDFDQQWADDGKTVWRQIAAGTTSASPAQPALAVPNNLPVATGNNMTLYVWTKDPAVAEMANGTESEYTFKDGTNRMVSAVTVRPSDTTIPFNVKGLKKGETTEIYLSASPTNRYEKNGITLITNFITRTIAVIDPPPPHAAVTLNGLAQTMMKAGPNHNNVVALNVELSTPYIDGGTNAACSVTIVPALRSGSTKETAFDYIGLSTRADGGIEDAVTNVTILAGQTKPATPLYVYAKRASEQTLLATNGVSFAVKVDGAAAEFFKNNENNKSATLHIDGEAPVIVSPTEGQSYTADGNANKQITIKVSDAFSESTYRVFWSHSGDNTESAYTEVSGTNGVPVSGDGTLSVNVLYPHGGTYKSLFYVQNADGFRSEPRMVEMNVKNPKRMEWAFDRTSRKYAEGEFATLTVTFTPDVYSDPTGKDAYLFLVPKTEAASNCVRHAELADGWAQGYQIINGETQTSFELEMLDGGANVRPSYQLQLRTAESWASGQLIEAWSASDITLTITNVVPQVLSAQMGDTDVDVNGATVSAKAIIDIPQTFALLDWDEPSPNDETAGLNGLTNRAFQTKWIFHDGGSTTAITVDGDPNTATNVSYAFATPGTNYVTVAMRDKDMTGQKFGPEFRFYVVTLDKPAIRVSALSGTEMFDEDEFGVRNAGIQVELTTPPGKEEVLVRLDVEWLGTADGLTPVLSTNYVKFGRSMSKTTFYLAEFDGTENASNPGFRIKATAVDGEKENWSTYYVPGEYYFSVANLDPVIDGVANTNETVVALNVPFTIPWRATDVKHDITNGVTVAWSGDVTPEPSYKQTGEGVSVSGVYTNTFTSPGHFVVTLKVTDKDNGFSTRDYYFWVKPSKEVQIRPHGPNYASYSALSDKYVTALGAGEGRVWAGGDGALSRIESFSHVWTFKPQALSMQLFAHGYRVGDQDNGALTPGTDYGVDSTGSYDKNRDQAFANWYKYWDATYDSFFYCWIVNAGGENGAFEGAHLGAIKPEMGVSDTGEQTLALDEYDPEAEAYTARFVEAIFAREWRTTDNVGDINQDGVPDVFAAQVDWQNGRLFEFAGFSVEDGGDLKRLDAAETQNMDADFLPGPTSTGDTLIPNVQANWAVRGGPFTARMELRGFHDGLNLQRNQSNKQGRNTAGTWISTRDFSEAELYACSNAWEKAVADGTFTGEFADFTAWSPENRTDPTLDDTDGDGFPDGYEYWFWYHAHVGTIDGEGAWSRLTGSRFRLADIAAGETITADEIEEAFNPNVASATDIVKRDTDRDGLTDMEEMAIGTNPITWDTDGDGVSDYWELMRGLNPLKDETLPGNGNPNPDGDYMAYVEEGSDYAILTFPDGKTYAWPNNAENYVNDDGSLSLEVTNAAVKLIRVYRYGNETTPYVPVTRGTLADDGVTYAAKPLDGEAVAFTEEATNITVVLDQKLALVHDQVYAQYGFDPRTAWNTTKTGYLAARWEDKILAKTAGAAGIPSMTRAYANLDEYLLLKYRYMTEPNLGFKLADDQELVSKDGTAAYGTIFTKGTTNPNVPYSDVAYGDSTLSFSSDVHGADTDQDGVPDGWELYVRQNPTGGQADGAAMNDGDTLTLVEEYAGTDSCAAYGAVETISVNHPGLTKGWYNKFFPTDPWCDDTDGDGILDSDEGTTWIATYQYGKQSASEAEAGGHTFSFIYGPRAIDGSIYGAPDADDGSLCIRGGGLNPCTVDTDGDLLPDTWEREFAGVLFKSGVPLVEMAEDLVTRLNRNDGMGAGATNVAASNAVARLYITGGMDGTFGPRPDDVSCVGDAYTYPSYIDPFTGTSRNFDFDCDGLQNFQEYLVQTLRHLRYDDSETPLMGRWMPKGKPGSGDQYKGFLEMNYFDGASYYQAVQAAGYTATGAWKFRELGYFARPPHEWDPVALDTTTLGASLYDKATGGRRVMLPPQGLSAKGARMASIGYASTNPRLWDTDNDGMDDYYEIFHGLNPLLGSIQNGMDLSGDVIAQAYGGKVSYWSNAWTGWPSPLSMPDWLSGTSAYRNIDPVKYPWMMGAPEADADGDGVRNMDEALVPNLTSPQAMHTDPTPLWMTDSTLANKASYTAQYYLLDPELSFYPWKYVGTVQTFDGASKNFLFAFEENEGYDTDRDGLSDGEERVESTTPLTDPQNFADPDRRQALWFAGAESAAVSYSSSYSPLNYGSYDFLRQFTVEAWICPEDVSREQVILERAAIYGASTLSNNLGFVRANFRLGLTAEGKVYGLFDSNDATESGTGLSSPRVVGRALAANAWTHVALTFNGTRLTLYVNGLQEATRDTQVIPANGIAVINGMEAIPGSDRFPVINNGYMTVPCALVLGARAVTGKGVNLLSNPEWSDYGAFYKGYLDEVRVWDGVRTQAEIQADGKKRYSFEDVKAQRDDVIFPAWADGAARNDQLAANRLPAELVMHYSFQTLPGAVNETDVAAEPLGFSKNVTDNVRVNGLAMPGGLACGWWSELPVKSTVYWNDELVPWIQNTCAHLPPMNGSAVDSIYWSAAFGGMTPAADLGQEKILFPNTANPYPYYHYFGDRATRLYRLQAQVEMGLAEENELRKYEFELRRTFVGSGDLLPLGKAFAKRSATFWDGNGPATVWTQTGTDTDLDGLPDWWETLWGRDLSLDSMVPYPAPDGREVTAREAYLRDLMQGMLPNGGVNISFRDVADGDQDGLPDWWESLNGLTDQTALNDDDADNLSNYAEYLISEVFADFGFEHVNPRAIYSYASDGQAVPDYFLTVGQMYLGEMFTDHDFMEDAWEDQFDPDAVSRFVADAWADPDNDGWSNYAESRAATDPTMQNKAGIDGYALAEHPVPGIKAKIVYNGDMTLDVPLVVQAYSTAQAGRAPDAVWCVGSLAQDDAGKQTTLNEKYLGYNTKQEVNFSMGPGSVEPGSVYLEFKSVVWHEYGEGGYVIHYIDDCPWVSMVRDAPSMDGSEEKGVLFGYGDINYAVGTIDYKTGDVTIDLSKMNKPYNVQGDSDGTLVYFPDQAYVKVAWGSAVPKGNRCAEVTLREPNATTVGGSLGRVREGLNTFTAFLDADGNGEWTPGEPFGAVTGVDVGWSGGSCQIELTDTASQTMRVNLLAGLEAEDFTAGNALTDRGVNGFTGGNVPTPSMNEEEQLPVVPSQTRVRLVRTWINLDTATPNKMQKVVFDGLFDLTRHPVLTEADLMAQGLMDLDWSTLREDWMRANNDDLTSLTNVAYAVGLGDASQEDGLPRNLFSVQFVNAFEPGEMQTPCTPVSPKGTVYTRPTFTWRHDNTINKAYPAFRLRVWSADGQTLVYDSGAQHAPVRNEDGSYSWTAPLYPGMMTALGTVFTTTANYKWSVSMLDAKFTTPGRNEAKQTFRLEAADWDGALGSSSDYGVIKAKVRYFGPATAATTAQGLVRVQAFESPDFTGVPAGEGYVTDVTTLKSEKTMSANVKLFGLKPGTYYLRAFIDTDGDGVWSRWESWGYGNYVGAADAATVRLTRGQGALSKTKEIAAVAFPFTPRAYTLVIGQDTPEAEIFIEDADTDNDGLPDAWEWTTNHGSLDEFSAPSGTDIFTRVNPELDDALNRAINLNMASTGISYARMPLLNTLANGSDAAVTKAAKKLLGKKTTAAASAPAPVTEQVAVKIDAFSLAEGIALSVTSTVTGESDGLFIVDDAATVSVRLVAAATPDFAGATEVPVKSVVIRANAAVQESVSAAEVQAAVKQAGLEGAAFFKVKLVQE